MKRRPPNDGPRRLTPWLLALLLHQALTLWVLYFDFLVSPRGDGSHAGAAWFGAVTLVHTAVYVTVPRDKGTEPAEPGTTESGFLVDSSQR